ncbi:hypothetical protein ASPCAL04003 [Aspergillus calidoustus]|uniref:Uncharacterized protein n=1 Tax=Aspergillus calidoustus TaxID=454130 RepID=A0A0U5FXH5_ASPCI|nr:hypothetical protein ASPCAL04003 [Aspergillus calidoustus]
MPSSRTPAHPLRQTARPQFASTPRFLFSQRSVDQYKRHENSDSILSEDDANTFHLVPTQTAPRGSTRQKDAIEDISSELGQEPDIYEQPVDGEQAAEIPSSPPVDVPELDVELDTLFGPTRSRAKRRRISVDLATPTTQPQTKKPRDFVQSSSPEPSFPAAEPPSPSLPYRTTPITPRHPATPATVTQSSRTFPRFRVLSSSRPLPNTQTQQRVRPVAGTPGPTTRKPAFVLPRSPSPEQEDPNGIPTPFSPSSHALRRKGRQRSSAPTYLPGGMAAEVRSWILEIGTKREQQKQAARDARAGNDSSSVDMRRYSLVICLTSIRQSALGSCGPLAFIQGQEVLSLGQEESADCGEPPRRPRNVLLLGAPRSRPGELRTSAPALGRWLVGMEWEVVSSST